MQLVNFSLSMKSNINLSVDRKSVVEGDVVEIHWACENVDNVQLTIDNGYKLNTIQVEPSGTKKFRLNRSKGKTEIVIGAMANGKMRYKSVGVRVKRQKVEKAEYVNDYTGAKGVRNNGLKNSWYNFKSKMKYAWGGLSEKKRLASVILLAVSLCLLISSFWKPFCKVGMLALVGYLFYVILKN